MAWWVYKCNSKNREYQNAYGEWKSFFIKPWGVQEWGSTKDVPRLAQLSQGDMILAYQTDRNEFVGICRVAQFRNEHSHRVLYLEPVEAVGVKVRPLKLADPRVATIPAFQPGIIKTVYRISNLDVSVLLDAAGASTPVDDGEEGPPRPKGLQPDDGNDEYQPGDEDSRRIVERQIRERRGQTEFRLALLKRYNRKCMISGCGIVDVLEAAHIKPYRGASDNNAANGLLLRADLHTLFDLDLIGIGPKTLRVRLHASLKQSEYGMFDGKRLQCGQLAPAQAALKVRWRQFKEGQQ